MGRRHFRHDDALPGRGPVGAAAHVQAADSRHAPDDAPPRPIARRLPQLRRRRGRGVRAARRRHGHRRVQSLRRPERRAQPGDVGASRQEGGQAPAGDDMLLGHRGRQARRADLQSGLLRRARRDPDRPRRRQPVRKGHGRTARPVRRLRAVRRAEEGGRHSAAAPHSLHQRHGLDVVRQGRGGWRRRRGRRVGAPGPAHVPAGRRAACHDVPRHRPGHRPGPRQAAEDGRPPRVGSAQVPGAPGEPQDGRHRREGVEPPDTGRHGEQPDLAAPRGRGHRQARRGAGGDPPHEKRAGVPAAGHPPEPDGRHAGRDERALRPVQAGRRRDKGLRVRTLRQASRAAGRGGRVEGPRRIQERPDSHHGPPRRPARTGAGRRREHGEADIRRSGRRADLCPVPDHGNAVPSDQARPGPGPGRDEAATRGEHRPMGDRDAAATRRRSAAEERQVAGVQHPPRRRGVPGRGRPGPTGGCRS